MQKSTRQSHTLLAALLFTLLAAGCTPTDDPQYIVDQAIAAHGGSMLDAAIIEFDYRGKHFKATRNNGVFEYVRTYEDSTGAIREVLNNDEAYREVNGARVEITEKKRYSIQEINNSVVYFGFVPYFLNDPAVQKKYLGTSTINGTPYHEIEITFSAENGGPDYEDRFVYWFNAETYTMDYLAYDFLINDGGTRFREAFNIRTIEGVRVADFKNYKSEIIPKPGAPIEDYDELLGTDDIALLSEIKLENVQISSLP
ncbi:MAG: DUF6503 family protein [Bacteroidota bacterium]